MHTDKNGFSYSRIKFEGYTHRAKVSLKTVDKEHIADIYTTCPEKEIVEDTLIEKRGKDVVSVNVFYFCTKEEDDATSKFIDEITNDFELEKRMCMTCKYKNVANVHKPCSLCFKKSHYEEGE